MSLLLILINAAYIVAKDFYNLKLISQKYRGAFIQNNVNEDLSKLLKEMCSQSISNLKDREKLDLTPEETERSALTMIKLATTIIDGNKVLASLAAPQEQQSQLKEAASQITSQMKDLNLLAAPESDPQQVSTNSESID